MFDTAKCFVDKCGIFIWTSTISYNLPIMTDKLASQGAKIYIGQKKENIVDGLDMVVYTAAIHPDNEELMAAKEKNILTINRAAFLGQIDRKSVV